MTNDLLGLLDSNAIAQHLDPVVSSAPEQLHYASDDHVYKT